MSQNKPLAAIYVRVSTQDQAQHGFSLDAQEDSLQNYAKALGYEIYKLYRDEGKSAKDLKRPEMINLLKDAEAKKFQAIFIYKLDRFSRSLKDLILTIDKLKELGIDFISLPFSSKIIRSLGCIPLVLNKLQTIYFSFK